MRRAGLTLLPPAQRGRLRDWYEGATAPRGGASASFAWQDTQLSGDRSVLVNVEHGPRFLISPDVQEDIEVHFRSREYAAEIAAFLRHAASPGVLFDVGANTGLFSLMYCQLHSTNRAMAYEPSPVFADRADRLARLNGLDDRLTVVREAVAEAQGSRQLLVDSRTGRVQAMQFEGTIHDSWLPSAIVTTTLDLEAARAGAPSMIKIDVEGYELEVLQGATEVLSRWRPAVLLEIHLNFLEERGIAPDLVCYLLTSQGYQLQDLSGRSLSSRDLMRSWAHVKHVVALPIGL